MLPTFATVDYFAAEGRNWHMAFAIKLEKSNTI